MKKINNYTHYNKCPLCENRAIHYIGPIEYENKFSSEIIELQNIPELWKCLGCESSYINNIIDEEQAKILYSKNDGIKWKITSFSELKTKLLIKEISEYLKNQTKILDIGSNYGELLDFAKSLGASTYGVELSDTARKTSLKNGHIIFKDLEEIPNELSFDIIFAFDLIEHLHNINLFLDKCYNLLKKDGRIIILTGNPSSMSAKIAKNKWWYARFPEHLIFPSKKFFLSSNRFDLKKYIKVYNSKTYEKLSSNPFLSKTPKTAYNLIYKLIKRQYNGIPSIDPDHSLIVLKKCSIF